MPRFPILPAGLLAMALLAAAALAILTAPAMAVAAEAPGMPVDQIRTLLAGEGYADLADLAEHGGFYTADAERFGVKLSAIRIDPVTGEVLDAPVLTPAQAGTLLTAKGYRDVSNVRATTSEAGAILRADATFNGQIGSWSIDPWTGAVYPATDSY